MESNYRDGPTSHNDEAFISHLPRFFFLVRALFWIGIKWNENGQVMIETADEKKFNFYYMYISGVCTCTTIIEIYLS